MNIRDELARLTVDGEQKINYNRRARARDAFEQVFGIGALACADLASKSVTWMERQVLAELSEPILDLAASRKEPSRVNGDPNLRNVVNAYLRTVVESNDSISTKLAKIDELLIALVGYTLIEDTIRAVRADIANGHTTRIVETCF
jgi:hypothetical protein